MTFSRSWMFMVFLAASIPSQTPIFVNRGATGQGNGSGWSDAYTDLQQALAGATSGSEIWVAAGVYLPGPPGTQPTFSIPDGVAIFGGFAGNETTRKARNVTQNVTILSGDLDQNDVVGSGLFWFQGTTGYSGNAGPIVSAMGVGSTTVLDGFTIENGTGTGGGLSLQSSDLTVENCVLRHHIAGSGAALAIMGGNPRFLACEFVENVAQPGFRAGAVWISGVATPTFERCRFLRNRCRAFGTTQPAGGAVYIDFDCPTTFTECVFIANYCEHYFCCAFYAGVGGAIFNFGAGTLVDRCRFINNWSEVGGAVFAYRSITLRDSLFQHNSANSVQSSSSQSVGGVGGSIGLQDTSGAQVYEITGCTIVDSHATDDGGGLFVNENGHATVTNCIFWGNTDSSGNVSESQCRGVRPHDSCVENLLESRPGEDPLSASQFPGSIDLPPQFTAPLGQNGIAHDEDDDFSLLATSPCIDFGKPTTSSTGLDQRGWPRFLDGNFDGSLRIDMGAFEYAHASLSTTLTSAPSGTLLTIDIVGEPNLSAFVLAGAPASPPTLLPPLGTSFIDLQAPLIVWPLGTTPATTTFTIPFTGFSVDLQGLVLDGQGHGSGTNPTRLSL